jgi:hypothetical protein
MQTNDVRTLLPKTEKAPQLLAEGQGLLDDDGCCSYIMLPKVQDSCGTGSVDVQFFCRSIPVVD